MFDEETTTFTRLPLVGEILTALANWLLHHFVFAADSTGSEGGEAKAHQQGGGDVFSPPLCAASPLGV